MFLPIIVFLDSASKHALEAFGDCLRAEGAEDNIHVTVIRPGYIQTKLSVNAYMGDGKSYGGEMALCRHSGVKGYLFNQPFLN